MRVQKSLMVMLLSLLMLQAPAWADENENNDGDKIDFATQIKPIFEQSCLKCHGEKSPKGEFQMQTRELLLKGGSIGPAIEDDDPEFSELYIRISLPEDDPGFMPADGKPLSEEQIAAIETWIKQGAPWPDDVTLQLPGMPEEDKDAAGLPITDSERAAVDAIREASALALRLAQNTNWLRVDYSLASQDITDGELAPLKEIDNLYELGLAKTQITDEGLAHLADRANLKRLNLSNTQISDAGLQHLQGLEKLEYLNLYGTKVTDAGLEHLKGLQNLKKLYLWETEVTDEGVAQLKETLPNVEIIRGFELAKAEDPEEEEAEEEEKKEEEQKEEKKEEEQKEEEKKDDKQETDE